MNINILIIGAGRMGIRHAEGICKLTEVRAITIVDNSEKSIENAINHFSTNSLFEKINIINNEKLINSTEKFEIGIIATTANNRIELLTLLVDLGCKQILVEKPLSQSFDQLVDFNSAVVNLGVSCFVNLNMRLNDCFLKLYNDIKILKQFQGEKTVTINTGTIGIGANGIHYLDYLLFLFEADEAKIVAAEIQEELISSGRGENFYDFGGWCVIKFYKQSNYLGKAMLSLSSTSSVFGSWEIVGPHGRIYFNEVEQNRIDLLRNENSLMPLNRYHADYLKPAIRSFESPFLGDLTNKWLKTLINENISLLPTIEQSLDAHKLMFDWLEHSKKYSKIFPIT